MSKNIKKGLFFVRNDVNKTSLEASTRTSTMLEQMLNGYDKRLRPNFAGKYQ